MTILLLFKAILVPLILYAITLRYRFNGRAALLVHQLFTISWVTALIIIEDFSAISLYWRIVIGVLLVVQLGYAIFRGWHPLSGECRSWQKWGTGIYTALALIYFVYATFCFSKLNVPADARERAVDIHFPLAGGLYDIVHGGMNTTLNYHYAYVTQKYALDITKINKLGLRKLPFSDKDDLNRYAIYGEPVLSPVKGKVIDIVDGIGEHIPPEKRTRLSNMIVLEYRDYYILLIHLKPGSIKVKKGDSVDLFQPLAEVGNSGNSTEPHLHIHAIRKISGGPADFIDAPAVPVTFNGHFLKRNDLLLNGKLIMR